MVSPWPMLESVVVGAETFAPILLQVFSLQGVHLFQMGYQGAI